MEEKEVLRKKSGYPDTFSVSVKEMNDLREGRYGAVEIVRSTGVQWISVELLRERLIMSPMRTNRNPPRPWMRHYYVVSSAHA